MKDCCLLPSNPKYIGLTTCTLSRRLTYHLQNGSIKKHHEYQCKNSNLNRPKIVENTKIRYRINDLRKLGIMESILIKFEKPKINEQDTGNHRILQLWG